MGHVVRAYLGCSAMITVSKQGGGGGDTDLSVRQHEAGPAEALNSCKRGPCMCSGKSEQYSTQEYVARGIMNWWCISTRVTRRRLVEPARFVSADPTALHLLLLRARAARIACDDAPTPRLPSSSACVRTQDSTTGSQQFATANAVACFKTATKVFFL